MPTYTIKDPESGEVVKMTGERPPTEAEITSAFAAKRSAAAAQVASEEEPSMLQQIGEGIVGTGELAATALTSLPATVASGVAGVAALPFGGTQLGSDVIEAVQGSLTYMPQTEAGQRITSNVGEFLSVIPETIEKAADFVFDLTGSPMLATMVGTAPTALAEYISLSTAGTLSRLPNAAARIEKLKHKIPDADIAPVKLSNDGLKIVADKPAVTAINQGWDEGFIAAIKTGSPSDKKVMAEMLSNWQKGRTNRLEAIHNSMESKLGEGVLRRVDDLTEINKNAVAQLDEVAQGLKGSPVNVEPAVGDFLRTLNNDYGVSFRYSPDGKLKALTQGTDIADFGDNASKINTIVERINRTDMSDAFEVHKLKRYLDNMVSYGKQSSTPMVAELERAIKGLRRGIDNVLDETYPDYNAVNTTISETLTTLDNVGQTLKIGVDIDSPRAATAVGNNLRKITSNYKAGDMQVDMLGKLDETLRKYGIKYDEDLIRQRVFIDGVNSRFGRPDRSNTLGQITEDAAKRAARGEGAAGTAVEAISKVGNRLLNKTDNKAISALEYVLKAPE